MGKRKMKAISNVLSLVIAFTMIFSNLFSLKVYADENQQDNDEIKYSDIMEKKEYKGNDYDKDDSENYDPDEEVRVIVQLDEESVKDYALGMSIHEAAKDTELISKVYDKQEVYKNAVEAIDSDIEILNSYSILLNGFSIKAKYKDIEKIKSIQGVKNVSISKKYYPVMNASKELSNVVKAWEEYGYKGEGLVVSVIDSGIDVNHKDMRLSNESTAKLTPYDGFTYKVPYGYNFADDNSDVKDRAEKSRGYMHGMHVAGIIGANCESEDEIKNNNGIRGVAPECQLLAMKVFSNKPNSQGANVDDIIQAIEQSVVHDADVINMSLGSPSGVVDPQNAEQVAIRQAVDAGIIVVAAAGNSYISTKNKYKGVKDTGLPARPGIAPEAIQVASMINSKLVGHGISYETDSESGTLFYSSTEKDPISTLKGEKYSLVDCNEGRQSDYKDKDFSGNKIALVKYNKKLSLGSKNIRSTAEKYGAKAVIIYSEDGDESTSNMVKALDKIPAAWISNTDGKKLLSLIDEVEVSFDNELNTYDSHMSYEMSNFSSWGPAANLDFKPEITGVGGHIYSTVNDNKYKNQSGTSMASPYMAGIMTLIIQKINESDIKFNSESEKVNFAKSIAINTSKALEDKKNNTYYSPRRQGAGLANAKGALDTNVYVTVDGQAVVALKEMDKVTKFTMKLYNFGDEDVTYDVKDLSGVLTEKDENIKGLPYDIKLEGASISFDKSSVTVEAKKEAEVTATITMNGSTPKNNFAEGFIKFVPQDKNEPELGMPYMGFYGEWDKLPIFDKPSYEEGSIYKEISLYTLRDGQFGTELYSWGKDTKPEHFAINPENEEGNNDVIPYLSFLRNASELTIDISDKDGNIIKTLAKKHNVTKEVVNEQIEYCKYNINKWKWDGTIYNPETGELEYAPEGQYYFNARAKINFDGAEEQVLSIPIKIDKTAPRITRSKFYDSSEDLNYTFRFNAEDNASGGGVFGFEIRVDGETVKDDIGREILKLKKNEESGMYEIDVKLSDEHNSPMHTVSVVPIDSALNRGKAKETQVVVGKDYGFKFTNIKKLQLFKYGKDINVEYDCTDKKLLEEMDHFEISVDYKTRDISIDPIKNGKNLSYTFKGGLPGGKCEIDVVALDSKGKALARIYQEVEVEYEKLGIDFKNYDFYDGKVYTSSSGKATIYGKLTSKDFKSFKINGQEVQVGFKYGSQEYPLNFKPKIQLEHGKANKLRMELIDLEGKKQEYAYTVFWDKEAPELTFKNIKLPEPCGENDWECIIEEYNREYDAEIMVDEDATEYTIEGTAKDDLFGYDLYVNEEVILNVHYKTPSAEKTFREFKHVVPLKNDVTIVKVKITDGYHEAVEKKFKIEKRNNKERMPFEIKNLSGKDEYKLGEQAHIKVEAKNISNSTKKATLIVGLFNKYNKMEDVLAVDFQVDKNKSVVLNGLINIPSKGEYKLKAFVWNTLEDGDAMCKNPYEFKIVDNNK